MNLATIQRAKGVHPHPNADALDIAIVNGWQTVIRKGAVHEGDLVAFIQLDSIVPELPCFEFLRNKQFRVRTIRLRGELSQGLVIPLQDLQDVLDMSRVWAIGDDLTDAIGVTKYEKPIPPGTDIIGPFCPYISKTDEERLQNISDDALQSFYRYPTVVTIKEDGTSATFANIDGQITGYSRNWQVSLDGDNIYARACKSISNLPRGMIVQGEIVGPGIQNNRGGYSSTTFKIFNAKYIHALQPLTFRELQTLCRELDWGIVCIQTFLTVGEAPTIAQWMEIAEAARYPNGSPAEGIVVRSLDSNCTILGKPGSFKVISNKYLLKHEE